MKKAFCILLLGLLGFANGNSQSLSNIRIIFESENQVITNNGFQYDVLSKTSFNTNPDEISKQGLKIFNHNLHLNRILVIKKGQKFQKLVEWSDGPVKFYEFREAMDFKIEENQISYFSQGDM